MGVARMVSPWVEMVRTLLPCLHGHQVKTLAAMALAMTCRESCRLSELALAGPTRAKPASVQRRFERLLANTRLGVEALADTLAMGLLAAWPGREALLVLDETPQREPLRCLRLSVAYRRRAIPLAWVCYDQHDLPEPMETLIAGLARRVAAALPAGVSVTLLADRGLSWPSLIDLCEALSWHFVLRLQGQTRVRRPGHEPCELGGLAPRPGAGWSGAGEVFKGAGWRAVNVVAWWEPGCAEPWLLVSDLPPTRKRVSDYRRRMWIEQSFRDDKSHGFNWQSSLVRDPGHAQRLLLVVALAARALLLLGARLIKRGERAEMERPDRRTYSLFSLGHRKVLWGLYHDLPPPDLARLVVAGLG